MGSARSSTIYDWHENAAFSRYCIEMQVAEFDNVTSPNHWVPGPSQFSDYASCNAGDCVCEATQDRYLTGQPVKQILAMCDLMSSNTTPCHCSPERQAETEKYIGMAHWQGQLGRLGKVYGRWYSMPAGGYCVPG